MNFKNLLKIFIYPINKMQFTTDNWLRKVGDLINQAETVKSIVEQK